MLESPRKKSQESEAKSYFRRFEEKNQKMKTSTLDFLKNLAKNNNREWFNENKNLYVDAHEGVISFVENLIEEIGKFDAEIGKLDAKKSLFRIYRDTRFSKNKSPYKTNFGAGLGMGKGNKISGYYLHFEPNKSFLAGGVYQPDPKILREIRKEISMNAEEFLKIVNDQNFKKLFKTLDQDEKLHKVPQGFEKDDKMADFLKLKNFIIVYDLKDDAFFDENAVKNFGKIYKAMKPLNDFLEAPFL
jgi:uncharacterized protein (TIGR02453 family)